MLRCTYPYLGLILFLLTLSCRSDARNLEIGTDSKKVEATIGEARLNDPTKPADVSQSIDSEGIEDNEISFPDISNPSEERQNDEITPSSEKEENVVKADTRPKKTAPEQEASSKKPTIEKVPDNPTIEPEISTAGKKPISDASEVSSPVNKLEEVEIFDEVEIVTKVETPIVVNIHDTWDALLKKYVTATGFVDYKSFKSELGKIDAYLLALSKSQPKDNDLGKDAMAFYINLYNAATVKLILDNYPLASIREINGGKPWDKVWIDLGGKKYSLNNIEHDILRPRFKDERVHFAVNCASASCPKIANRAFRGSDLEFLLDKLTREFVNDSRLNTIDPKAPQLSKLFQWYQGDFDNVIDFVNQYSELKVSAAAKITYKDYLWNLNGK